MDGSLTDIANEFGTDKGTIGPSAVYGGHNYTDVYEAYMRRVRGSSLQVLEIGIGARGEAWQANIVQGRNSQGGGSIRMWEKYFPNAHVYGIDINDAKYLESERIHTYKLNQGSREELAAFVDSIGSLRFDFIIDDGSHRPDHQQLSLGMLFPLLKAGGIYFIEDLSNNGKGDVERGRHVSDAVYNTRKVLRAFNLTGDFLEPHSIPGYARLKDEISCIVFHCPLPRIVYSALISRLLGKRGILVQSRPNSERLAAIIKRS